MFCRNCGNKLADNAKFCNLCGTPVPKPVQQEAPKPAAPVQPIPTLRRPQPAQAPVQPEQPATQPAPRNDIPPQGQQPYYGQPEQPIPTAPMYVPPQQAPAVQPDEPLKGGMLAFGLITAAVCVFLICSVFFKGFIGKGFGTKDFGTFSYLQQIGKVGKTVGKNVFTFSWEGIKSDVDSAVVIIALWLHILLEIIAAIFVILAAVRAFGRNRRSELKMWGDLKISALCSFLGIFLTLAGVVFAVVRPRIAQKQEVFKNWWTVPGFFIYFFVGLSLLTLIVCSVMKRRTRAKFVNEQAAMNMSYHPFRI